MSAEYAVVLADKFTSTADKISESADKTHAKIVALQTAAKQGVRMIYSGPVGSISRGSGGNFGSPSGRSISDEWQRMAANAERAEARRAAASEKATARSTAAKARAAMVQERSQVRLTQREAANTERAEKAMLGSELRRIRGVQREEAKAARDSELTAKRRAAATEKAAHKYYYGGKKSFGSLVHSQHEQQVSAIASRAAGHLTPLGLAGAAGSGLGMAADAVGALVTGSATIAYNFGKATIAAQSMREESVEGFKAIYGTAVDADKLFDDARNIAKLTKFETPEVIAQFNTLAASGFAADQLKRIYLTTADVGSARGKGKQAQYTRGLSKLNAQDAAMFGTFQQAAMAGPGLKNAEQSLAKHVGINFTPKGGLDEHLRKMFRGHKIKGITALESVIGATNSLYNKKTGKEGEFAYGQGDKTWSGAISNIKAGLGDVLNMKMDDQKGLARFKTLLQTIGSSGGLFDQTSERGKRFAILIGKFVEDIFRPFGGITLDTTGNILDKILAAGEALEKKFSVIMQHISEGFDRFVSDAKGSIISLATDIGVAIGMGIWEGIKGIGRGAAQQGAMSLQESLTQKGTILGNAQDVIDAYGPASWSRQAAGMPGYAAGGEEQKPSQSLALGGIVQGPTGSRQLIYAHGGEIVSGMHGEYGGRSGGRAGSTYNICVSVMIQGSHDPVATAQRSAAEIEMVMDRYFGRLAAQG